MAKEHRVDLHVIDHEEDDDGALLRQLRRCRAGDRTRGDRSRFRFDENVTYPDCKTGAKQALHDAETHRSDADDAHRRIHGPRFRTSASNKAGNPRA